MSKSSNLTNKNLMQFTFPKLCVMPSPCTLDVTTIRVLGKEYKLPSFKFVIMHYHSFSHRSNMCYKLKN